MPLIDNAEFYCFWNLTKVCFLSISCFCKWFCELQDWYWDSSNGKLYYSSVFECTGEFSCSK